MKESCSSEEVNDWEAEAEAIIRDVRNHVKLIAVSKKLTSNSFEIYLNLTTLENKDFCIRASGSGFRIVAEEFDKVFENTSSENNEEEDSFETPYALLNKISHCYVESFANQLAKKLQQLDANIQ